MIEVEIKVKIEDPENIEKKFLEFNGKYKLSLIHEDTYFNMPRGLRNLARTDEALRVRKSESYNKNNKSFPHSTKYYFTYKGSKIDKETKTRNELEVKVDDGNILKKILKILGFREIFTVKKQRELYEFDFNGYKIEALIDYIPILDEYFIEVEYIAESDNDLEKIRQLLFKFLEQFGIEKERSIRKSYLELIAEHLRNKKVEKN